MVKRAGVLAIGSIYVDINSINFPFSSSLSTEEEVVGEHYEAVLGGSAVNFAKHSAELGVHVILIGKIGNDVVGHLAYDLLAQCTILPDLIWNKSVSTNLGINIANAYGRRVMIVLGNANQSLRPKEVADKLDAHIEKISHLYIGGYLKLKSLTGFFPKIVKKAQAAGVKVIVDHGRVTNVVSEQDLRRLRVFLSSLSEKDYYLPAEKEFLKVFGARNIASGLTIFRRDCQAAVVVKQSSKGATGMLGSEMIYLPAYRVQPTHTIGAGDAFNAGFVKAQIEKQTFEESIRFANATAAEKVAHGGILVKENIERLIHAL